MVVSSLVNPFFAYIDPGTGSLLVSTLIGISMAVLFSLKGLFYSFIGRFTGQRIKMSHDFSGKLVFFNEGKNYWKVFQPVIDALIKSEQHFIYLSADREDMGLQVESDYIESHYLGKMNQAIITLNRLKADAVVMTTPQLNIMTLRRSKEVRHYCHLLHAPADIHTYKKFAFDDFDSVLCSSQFQIDNLRQLETNRQSKMKQLFATGCTYYDLTPQNIGSPGEAVLVAPTWGDKSFLKEGGESLIRQLLEGGEQVIFRPHPQSWISESEFMEQLLRNFTHHPCFELDRSLDSNTSIARARLVICDVSGIVYDIAFVHKKNIIAVHFDNRPQGYEAYSLSSEQSVLQLLKDVGQLIELEDLQNIHSIIDRTTDKPINQDMIDTHIFNFGKAGPVASEQILSIYAGAS